MDDLGPYPSRFRSHGRPGDCCGHTGDRRRARLADFERDRSVQAHQDMVAGCTWTEVAHLRAGNDGIEFATIAAQQDHARLHVDRFDDGLSLDEVANDNRLSVQWYLVQAWRHQKRAGIGQ